MKGGIGKERSSRTKRRLPGHGSGARLEGLQMVAG